jgi:hypothetical protein
MVELDVIEFLFQLSYLLPVCSHAGVTIVQLSHDLIDDEFKVSANERLLNPKLSDNV